MSLFVLPLTETKTLRPFLQTKAYQGDGRFSPDGRWVAYDSDESGRNEVYVRPFPGPATSGRSQPTGLIPLWSQTAASCSTGKETI